VARVNKGRSASSRRKQYSAPALEKGLDILELLSGEPQGLNISELAKRMGRSVGEVFRMMAVLEQRKYIQLRDDSDAYVLTLKMFALSHRISPVSRLSAAAIPVMRQLAWDTRQSCHLVIHYEGQGHVVGQEDGPTDRTLSVRLGAEAPLLDTCSGHVLLAFADDVERERMLEKIPETQRRPGDGEIDKLVRRVRQRGYEIIRSAQIRGVQDIGYPVFDRSGQVIAALAVPYLAYLDDDNAVALEDVVAHTAAAAERISAALGKV